MCFGDIRQIAGPMQQDGIDCLSETPGRLRRYLQEESACESLLQAQPVRSE
jgi:hypothetical protein